MIGPLTTDQKSFQIHKKLKTIKKNYTKIMMMSPSKPDPIISMKGNDGIANIYQQRCGRWVVRGYNSNGGGHNNDSKTLIEAQRFWFKNYDTSPKAVRRKTPKKKSKVTPTTQQQRMAMETKRRKDTRSRMLNERRKQQRGVSNNNKKPDRRTLTPKETMTIIIEQEGKCNHCKRKLDVRCMQRDHIKELADGGSNRLDNFQILCSCCHDIKTNTRKTARADERRAQRWNDSSSISESSSSSSESSSSSSESSISNWSSSSSMDSEYTPSDDDY